MRLERLKNLPLNTVTPNFVAIFVFFSTASLFNERISSSETETKREAILFLFSCSEVNSTWLITSELTNQCARKVLFTCVVFTNYYYSSVLVDFPSFHLLGFQGIFYRSIIWWFCFVTFQVIFRLSAINSTIPDFGSLFAVPTFRLLGLP